jgi:hypothetical protein
MKDKPDALTAEWIQNDCLVTMATWDGWTNMLPDGTQRRIGDIKQGEGYIDVSFGDPHGSRATRRMRIRILAEDLDQRYESGDVVSFDYLEGRREGTIQGIVQPRDAGGERLYLVGVVENQHHPFRKKASELKLVRRAGET